VVEKRMGRPPHETLLVVDAAIGRNALEQVRVWNSFAESSCFSHSVSVLKPCSGLIS